MSLLRVAIIGFFALGPIAWADTVADAALAGPDPVAPRTTPASFRPWPEVLNRYLAASQEQQTRLHDSTMEVQIEARLPRLKKEAQLHALRQITRVGQITYQAVRSAGDKMALKEVVYNYLRAETEASKNGVENGKGKTASISITPENYKFKFRGTASYTGRPFYVIQVSPKKKRVGLFKGEIWVDAETFLPVRESGTFVKNPSVFLKKVQFVREYELRNGIALPLKIQTRVDARIVGKAELDINFSNYSVMAQARICPMGW